MKTNIEMAREARAIGFVHDAGEVPFKWLFTRKELEVFAALVRADEREACAKVCESLFDMTDDSCSEAEECAAAIRARGNT